MKKNILIVSLACLAFSGCASVPQTPNKKGQQKVVVGQAGRSIPFYSLSIDANYDSRLDHLISGYKMLPVIMRNSSLQSLPMDDKKDRWVIVGEKGTRYAAINTLRVKNPVAWRDIPERMRTMIDYPEIIPINYSVTFDLLLPEKANLEYFREIRYYNATLKQQFVIGKEY